MDYFTDKRYLSVDLQLDFKDMAIKNFKNLLQKNLIEGQRFLEENALRPEVISKPSGLQYEIIVEGSGKIPQVRSQVVCHYKGTLIDGTVFDDSYKRNKPETFYVYELIPAWIEALLLMTEGSKWKLYVPPHIAYGKEALTSKSGGNCTLIFDMELIKVI